MLKSEETALVVKNKDKPADNESTLKNSILLRTGAFGLNGMFFAAHLLLNGKYLSMLGTDGAAASSLMSTYQSVILGSCVGGLLGTGLDFGKAVGERKYIEAGAVVKTASILALALGGVSASAMMSTRIIFPLLFPEGPAELASDFFTGYAAASWPLLFLIVAPQVAFQEGEWYIPPGSMFAVFTTSGIVSYLLGFQTNLGALGIGLGGTIGSSLSALTIGAWFIKKNYSKYRLYNPRIENFMPKLKSLLASGWKLSLQRFLEWGNLLAITTIVGFDSSQDLEALNPSMLYLTLFGTTFQGFAAAAGMIIFRNKGAIQKALESHNNIEINGHHKNNIQTLFRSSFFGASLSTVIFATFYLARKPFTELFLSEDVPEDTLELAETLLWINMLGLIPDSCRIITSGALRGWKELLYPTLISFLLMTVIGVPAAYGLSIFWGDESENMVSIRDITILISTLLIFSRSYINVKKDERELREHIEPTSFFKTGLSLWGNKKEGKIIEVDVNDTQINYVDEEEQNAGFSNS